MSDRLALRVPDVAAALGASEVQVTRWLVRGELPGRKVGRTWFVLASELEARLSSEVHEGDARGRLGPQAQGEAPRRQRASRLDGATVDRPSRRANAHPTAGTVEANCQPSRVQINIRPSEAK